MKRVVSGPIPIDRVLLALNISVKILLNSNCHILNLKSFHRDECQRKGLKVKKQDQIMVASIIVED